MTNKHTPGPWAISSTRETVVVGKNGKPVALLLTDGLTSAEVAENARLIASAPELMAALSMVIENHSKHLDGFAFEKCHSAIAKAAGS